MNTLYIKNKSCPFCETKLIERIVHCPNNIYIPCFVCSKCSYYFYTREYYKLLQKLAEDSNSKLGQNVIECEIIKTYKKSTQNKSKPNKKARNKLKDNDPIKQKNRNKILARIKFKRSNECYFYEKIHCYLLNEECDPSSPNCKFIPVLPEFQTDIKENGNTEKSKYVKAIVLSHIRKCIHEEHYITDTNAIFKIATTGGNVIDISVPATYCKQCNQYIVLKSDFKSVRRQGSLLCQVEDKKPEYLSKHRGSYSGTESRIHSLGYNVIKQYGYTFEQRKMILANIIENYNITKHEILSMLDTNIARKIGLKNYADAVDKWRQDREFVANYERGDIPDIIIEKVVVGSRK